MVSIRIYKTKDDLVMVLFNKKSKLIMSSPKEKALELYKTMFKITESQIESKQCALIAVDFTLEFNDFHIEYLYEVKQEIEKL
jgi:hypothetical protein